MIVQSEKPRSKHKVALITSGEGNVFKFLYKSCLEGIVNAEVVCVLSDRECGFLNYAKEKGIPILLAASEKKESSLSVSNKLYTFLKKNGFCPDIICLAYDRLILGDFLNEFKNRLINCHPGLLPGFKGFNAIDQTMDSSAQLGGCSIHLCNEKVDDGAVIIQSVIPLSPYLTKDEYGAKLFNCMKRDLSQVVQWFAEDRLQIKKGKVNIKNARYGSLPDNPSIEIFKNN